MPPSNTTDTATIYKICPRAAWEASCRDGIYRGSADDARDGFIHFSAWHQLAATAAKHFRGQDGLVLISVHSAGLGDALQWEPSRGGDLFPHLYAPLPVTAAQAVVDLTLGSDGVPQIPETRP